MFAKIRMFFLNSIDSSQTLQPVEMKFLEDLKIENFTATGLTYDSLTNTYWIADHGTNLLDPVRLIQIDCDMDTILSIIQIGNYVYSSDVNVQGLAYDCTNDSFLVACGPCVTRVNRDGEILEEFSNQIFKDYKANGVCIDPSDNSVWILCYSNYLLHFDYKMNLIEKYNMSFPDQDMIFADKDNIYITAGADYKGEDNYLLIFSKKLYKILSSYRLFESYAVEGLCMQDKYLYVINDGLYHDAKIPKTYVTKYLLADL